MIECLDSCYIGGMVWLLVIFTNIKQGQSLNRMVWFKLDFIRLTDSSVTHSLHFLAEYLDIELVCGYCRCGAILAVSDY
jgi:hypothetical protein